MKVPGILSKLLLRPYKKQPRRQTRNGASTPAPRFSSTEIKIRTNSGDFEQKEKNKMAEQQAESRRGEVETPNTRREVGHSEATRYPERHGISGAALAAIVVGVIALAAIIILFALNRQDTTNDNLAQQQPPTTIVQQPAQQPPVVVQQPATQPAPVIINGQPAPSSRGTTTSSGPDDATIPAAIDKKLTSDPAF